MRQVLSVVLVVALVVLGVKFKNYFSRSMAEAEAGKNGPVQTAPGKLPGLPIAMEPALEEAKKTGADGLLKWLSQHRQEIEDPRLADIELDYVVLAGRTNPGAARRMLTSVRQRVGPGSPVLKRLEQLEKVYP